MLGICRADNWQITYPLPWLINPEKGKRLGPRGREDKKKRLFDYISKL